MRRLRNVRLFKAGTWNGELYSRARLDQAVENFRRFQTPGPKRLQRAPIIVGHGPDLNDDRMPKRGDVLSLRRDDDWLIAPEMEADDDLADAIEAGNYDDVSAEFYTTPPEGIPGNGLMFRRLAILGAEIPHVKGLNPEGLAAKIYGERRFKVTIFSQKRGKYRVFSEERSMDRDAMMTALVSKGLDHDVVEGMDDTQLAEMMKLISGGAAGGDTAGTFAEMPEDKDKAAEACRGMAAKYKEKFGEELPAAAPSAPVTPMTQPERQFSEAERADIVRFTETYRDHIDPAELDESAGGLTLIDVALALDNTKRVHKFTEKGITKTVSDREAYLKSIRDRKIRYGGQKFRDGKAGPVTFAESATRKDKVKAFAEAKSDKLAKIPMTPDEYVKAWEVADEDQKAELESGVGFTG